MEITKTVDHYSINLNQLLGQGSFAKVYKAKDLHDPSIEAAVKTVPFAKIKNNQEYFDLFVQEIEVLRKLKGEHIAQLLEVKLTPNHLYIFIEFCDGGSLGSQLAKGKTYSEEEACSIIKQIASAFADLENMSIEDSLGRKSIVMHRDIKPDNILFHKGKVKVADFGFATLVTEMDKNLRKSYTICGTPYYQSPQLIARQPYSAKCDIWSTGVLFYEILFGIVPWAKAPVSRLEAAMRARPFYFPRPVSAEVKDLMNKMLMVREEDRISWKEILRHPAITRLRRDVVQEKVELLYQPMMAKTYGSPYNNKGGFEKDIIPNKQENVTYIKLGDARSRDTTPNRQARRENNENFIENLQPKTFNDAAWTKLEEVRSGDATPINGRIETYTLKALNEAVWNKLGEIRSRDVTPTKRQAENLQLKTLNEVAWNKLGDVRSRDVSPNRQSPNKQSPNKQSPNILYKNEISPNKHFKKESFDNFIENVQPKAFNNLKIEFPPAPPTKYLNLTVGKGGFVVQNEMKRYEVRYNRATDLTMVGRHMF